MTEQLEEAATPPSEANAAVWGLIERLALDANADVGKLRCGEQRGQRMR